MLRYNSLLSSSFLFSQLQMAKRNTVKTKKAIRFMLFKINLPTNVANIRNNVRRNSTFNRKSSFLAHQFLTFSTKYTSLVGRNHTFNAHKAKKGRPRKHSPVAAFGRNIKYPLSHLSCQISASSFVFRISEHDFRIVVFYQFAEVHEHRTVGDTHGLRHVVRYDEDGYLVLELQ